MKRKDIITAAAALLFFLFAAFNSQAQSSIDLDKMERDLKIMENVLETVVDEGPVQDFFSASRVKGCWAVGSRANRWTNISRTIWRLP